MEQTSITRTLNGTAEAESEIYTPAYDKGGTCRSCWKEKKGFHSWVGASGCGRWQRERAGVCGLFPRDTEEQSKSSSFQHMLGWAPGETRLEPAWTGS